MRSAVRFAGLPDGNKYRLPSLLLAIAPHLPDDVVPEAFGLLDQVGHDRDESECLAALIPRLPKSLHGAAMIRIERLHWSPSHPIALAAMKDRISDAEFDAAIRLSVSRIGEMITEQDRIEYLDHVAPLLNSETLPQVLHYGHFQTLRSWPLRVIQVFARNVSADLLPEVVLWSEQQRDLLVHLDVLHTAKAQCRDDLRQTLPERLSGAYERYLTRAADRDEDWPGMKFFEEHADLIPDDQIMLAWHVAASSPVDDDSGAAMEALIHRLPEGERPRAYGQIAAKVSLIRDKSQIMSLGFDLVGRLPGRDTSLETRVHEAADAWLSRESHRPHWSDVFKRMEIMEKRMGIQPDDDDLIPTSLEGIELDPGKCHKLLEFIHWYPLDERERRCEEGLAICRQIKDVRERFNYLLDLLDAAPSSKRDRVLESLLDTVSEFHRSEWLRELARLVPLLTPPFLVRASDLAVVAVGSVDPEEWLALMVRLAGSLEEFHLEEVYRHVLERLASRAGEGSDESFPMMEWFSALIRFHPDAVRREVAQLSHLDAQSRLGSSPSYDEVRRVSPESRPTIELALQLPDPSDRASALTRIAEVLVFPPSDGRHPALAIRSDARAISSASSPKGTRFVHSRRSSRIAGSWA